MFAIMVVKSFAVIFAFPCSIILLTNSAASLRVLGTLNGVAVSVSAIGRALGPAGAGWAFTWGEKRGYIITAWWALAVVAAVGAVPIWFLIEMEGFSKSGGDDDELGDEEESMIDQVDEESAVLHGDEVFDDEEENEMRRTESGKSKNIGSESARSSGASAFERRLSSPIGLRESVGPGGGRRLSNGLAASNLGQGTGGTSFA